MTPDDLARFRKILGLLGSDQVGERAAAALKATQFLASHGLSWTNVALPVSAPSMAALANSPDWAPANMGQNEEQARANARDLEQALRNANAAQQQAAAQRKAAWERGRYETDADGFDPWRK